MIVTFGILSISLVVLVCILQRIGAESFNFSNYAIGNRSFGTKYQTMSLLNTWYPGAMFTAWGSMAVMNGVMSFYVLNYSLLTLILMYIMARPVWAWGKQYDLKTQPDFFALRYNSNNIRIITAAIGIISGIPMLILSMQALGEIFKFLSLGSLSFSQSVFTGVMVIALRQIWTIKIGMNGVVISDYYQGIVSYIFGTMMLIGLILWLVFAQGIGFDSLPESRFHLSGFGDDEGPLYLFSIVVTGTLGGWCWPYIFVRLFTAKDVNTLKRSAAHTVPISFMFCTSLLIFCMLASALPEVAADPEGVWFLVSKQAGGYILLGLAGMIVMAASMGHIDGHIQATGAQIANDIFRGLGVRSSHRLIIVSKICMLAITLLCSWLACLQLPALFSLAVLSYQGIIQLSVPQFLGMFWKRGNKHAAICSMSAGFLMAVLLEVYYASKLPYGLTSGVVALPFNLAIYLALSFWVKQTPPDLARVNQIFRNLSDADKA
ncbi:solute:Na+ symporter, SSS family [Methylophilus rhizosphaerae]|uniref:Solute:Na+ symporter, SSS family n=1 Tax=Methylophilus rhizosphaerae TaxID=492660 RepID=A0A1G9D7X2_9PROT|nr:sodium:solute symporter family protein [Methylophilus rhizosphaerae]SDK59963.1 solute:Na+ symporter, SSS family [Methylophilus rhizosphaerae]